MVINLKKSNYTYQYFLYTATRYERNRGCIKTYNRFIRISSISEYSLANQSQSTMFRGLFVVLSLFVFLVNAKNYEWGTRDPKDRLLAREFAYKSAFFLLRVDAEVVYNPYRLSRSLKVIESI